MTTFVRKHRIPIVILLTVIPALFTKGPTVTLGNREWVVAGWAYGSAVIALSVGYLSWCWWKER